MSLSAIVLEEAYGRGPKSSQDGLLTALELQSLDFHARKCWCSRSAAWPMACHLRAMESTACAAPPPSQRETFVAPLVNVSDSTERALMARFYKELSMAAAARCLALACSSDAHAAGQKLPLLGAVILFGDPSPLPKQLFATAAP